MSDAPRPPPTTTPPRARTRFAQPKAKRRSRLPWIIAGVGLLAVAATFLLLRHGPKASHDLPVDWPVAKDGGAVVPIAHAVRAGDLFTTTADVRTGVVMAGNIDPMQGMLLSTVVRWKHQVAAADAGALRSTITVLLDQCSGSLPLVPNLIKQGLVADHQLEFLLDRDATGRPVPKSGRVTPPLEPQRDSLEYCMAGLSDVTTNYLPPREIRIGEVWDLADTMSMGSLIEVMRMLATLNPSPAGFPKGGWKGAAGAEAVETRDGEDCVRVKLALLARDEGDVQLPAEPGWISALVRIEGRAWVSTKTGILWGLETTAEGESTYDTGRKRELRRVRQIVSAKTTRGE
jgi:hypothetical protein